MHSAFARDLIDQDLSIKQAVAERPSEPIKIRLQPTILRKDGQYRSWADVRWILECDSAAEAFATRDAMRAFFDTMARCGPTAVRGALRALATAKTRAGQGQAQEAPDEAPGHEAVG